MIQVSFCWELSRLSGFVVGSVWHLGQFQWIDRESLTFLMFKNVGFDPNPAFAATIPFALYAIFQFKFAIITPALVPVASLKNTFSSLLLFVILFHCLSMPHWRLDLASRRFSTEWGCLTCQWRGSAHLPDLLHGWCDVSQTEERRGRQSDQYSYILLGAGLLWFDGLFNAESALPPTGGGVRFLNTNLASATAMVAWLLMDGARGKKRSVVGAAIAAVVGLVAITPAAGFVNAGQSIFIGFSASMVSYFAVRLKSRTSIDDTLDVFPCHGLGGIVGMILTAVFAEQSGAIYGDATLLLYHLLALVIVSLFTFGGSYLLYKVTDLILPMRVTELQEERGLDITQHGELATDIRDSY